MNNIRIVTDSTCDLSPDLLNKHNIAVVPLYVVFKDESFKDGVDINNEKLYEIVEKNNNLPMTSAPAPGDFINTFKPIIDAGDDIVYIGISSKISATVQNALLAAQEFPEGRIAVLDSENLSTGLGLLVLKAVDYVKEGLSNHEIVEKLSPFVPNIRTRFIINTLDYLHKGGRCSAMQSFVGGLLKIRPIVAIKDGKMILEEKIRGKRDKVLANMIDNVMLDRDNMDGERLFITHSMAHDDVLQLKKEFEEKLNVREVIITDTGCVVSSHCGPLTIGIIYLNK